MRPKCRGQVSEELDGRQERLMRESIEDEVGMIQKLWNEVAALKLEIHQLKREKSALLSELLDMQRAAHVERGHK